MNRQDALDDAQRISTLYDCTVTVYRVIPPGWGWNWTVEPAKLNPKETKVIATVHPQQRLF